MPARSRDVADLPLLIHTSLPLLVLYSTSRYCAVETVHRPASIVATTYNKAQKRLRMCGGVPTSYTDVRRKGVRRVGTRLLEIRGPGKNLMRRIISSAPFVGLLYRES
jgi:hypothetical protein